MPNRVIREGFLDSDPINALSEEAQNFFIRLMLVVDDYGRFDGRPQTIKSRCYPLDNKTAATVRKLLSIVCQAKLVTLYEVEGKTYIQLEKFNQRLRQKREKWPNPTSGQQLAVNSQHVATTMPETETETETETEKIGKQTQKFKAEILSFKANYPDKLLEAFFEFWSEPNGSRTKMRYQMQKTWDLGRRLKRWANNDKNFKNQKEVDIYQGIKTV